MLYLGYVGFSLVFSLGIAVYVKNDDKNWLIETKRWSNNKLDLLTAGIALGSTGLI